MLCAVCGKEFRVGLVESVRHRGLLCAKCKVAHKIAEWNREFDKRLEELEAK